MSTSTIAVQEIIASRVQGKKVLDIGCVNHSSKLEGQSTWLHRYVVNSAASVLGVDILRSDVEALAAQGYKVVCADAMRMDLGDTFDVVVAGELIEHVDNPGMLLTNIHKHLRPNGTVVLTTPNAFFLLHELEALFSLERRWNEQHVCWYDFFTLTNLFERNGFTVSEKIYATRSRKLRKVLAFLHLPCPKWFASTLIITARRS